MLNNFETYNESEFEPKGVLKSLPPPLSLSLNMVQCPEKKQAANVYICTLETPLLLTS
jgi:hypothetical protein